MKSNTAYIALVCNILLHHRLCKISSGELWSIVINDVSYNCFAPRWTLVPQRATLCNSNIIRETFEAVSNWLGSLAGPYLYIELPRKQENGRKTRRQISPSSIGFIEIKLLRRETASESSLLQTRELGVFFCHRVVRYAEASVDRR